MADDFQEETTPFEAFMSKAGESVPIVGAPYRKAVAYLESLSPFFSMRHAEMGQGAPQKTYEQALADENALMAQRAQEHPHWTTGGEFAGNLAGYAALPASSMASLPASMATTGAVSALDRAARGGDATDVLESGLGGAIGGGVGYLGGKLLSKTLGKAADWMGIRAAGGTTAPNYKDIKNIARTMELEPGGIAALGREQGIIGGPKTLEKVAERAEAAGQHVNDLRMDLIRQADESGSKVALGEVLDSIKGASRKGIQPKYLDSALEEAQDELRQLGGVPTPKAGALAKAGLTPEQFDKLNPAEISHGQLQDWLATRSSRASGIANAISKGENVSPSDRAFYRVYTAGRDIQDEVLGRVFEGAGEEARTLRRLEALDSTIHRVAKNRSDMLASQHPLGLIGSMSALEGVHQLMAGNVKAGAGLLALALGKATGPYRANILTSALSIPQQGLERGMAGGVPQILGATVGSKLGASKKTGAKDDFEPDQVAGKNP